MRVFNIQAVSRPGYFDRNGVPTNTGAITGAVAPHAETVRATYTVPVGKKAWLAVVWMFVSRLSAAGTPAFSWSAMKYTPSGGSTRYIDEAVIATNGVNDFNDRTVTGFEFMAAGDKYDLVSGDSSTTGTCDHELTAKHTEFDA